MPDNDELLTRKEVTTIVTKIIMDIITQLCGDDLDKQRAMMEAIKKTLGNLPVQ